MSDKKGLCFLRTLIDFTAFGTEGSIWHAFVSQLRVHRNFRFVLFLSVKFTCSGKVSAPALEEMGVLRVHRRELIII